MFDSSLNRKQRPLAKFRILASAILAVVILLSLSYLPTRSQGVLAQKAVRVTWLGHSAFEIVSPRGTRLLIDPFLKNNPTTPQAFKDLSRYKPNAILVSHSHFDHSQDAAEIARTSGAPLVAEFLYAATLGLPDKQQLGGNAGGSFTVGDVKIHLVPAIHSSEPGGRPLGFVLSFSDGRSLYHTGDTAIFGDMSLIEEMYHPTVMLLDVGGGPHGEDPQTAALAVKKYFNPRIIVPIHFANPLFPTLVKEPEVRAAFKGDRRLKLMKPGETIIF